MPDSPGVLEALIRRSHQIVPDDVPGLMAEHARDLGSSSAELYLVDTDQRWLVPLSPDGASPLPALSVEGTLAGRCYRSLEILDRAHEDGGTTVWVPVVDGTERLGVAQYDIAAGDHVDRDELRALTGLIGELIMTKSAYGDYFEFARRPQPFTVTAELAWQLMPPRTFGSPDVVIAAALIPTEELGGDTFDYGVDARTAKVAIFDAMGHALTGGLLATTAVASYRNGRRSRLELPDTAELIGTTIKEHFGRCRFVTGILSTLDRRTGEFSWCVAGHPPPLLLRGGRVIKDLTRGTGQPFGIGPASAVWTERLEPGDRVLLYTDGVTEARTADGELFGLDKLTTLLSRTTGDDPPPETMRRLVHAIQAHNHGRMRDDATVVMVEWRGPGSEQMEH